MKKKYNRSISLKCATCGDTTSFEFNEDKTWVKCVRCETEYHGGYDELVELNEKEIDKGVETIKKEVSTDFKNKISKMLRDTPKGKEI